MTIPKPKPYEGESKFIPRCMSEEQMIKDYLKRSQRAAVCYSSFRRKKK